MIFPSLQGEDDLDYTNRVANVWKVKGDKALMLFVFVQDHKIRIQVGYGLEADVTDAYSSRVIRETIAPAFKQGQYAAGLNAGLDQLAKKIDPNFAATGSSAQPVQQRPAAPTSSMPAPSGSDIVILIVLFLVFLFVILPLLRRGGCGGCGGCLLPMFWGGGGGTFGGGGFSGGGGGWSTGGSWGGGGSSFGGGGAGGSW